MKSTFALMAMVTVSVAPLPAFAQSANDRAADKWARETEAQMTDEERVSLVHGMMPLPFVGADMAALPADAVPGSGYVPGIDRLGVPSLRETDASLGITNPLQIRAGDTATAFPSSLALGASFNPELARRVGEILGKEARSRGFNVMLGGGINLARDPRNGRNFEYISEDPLLSGILGGEAVIGTQSQNVISTLKHFSLNSLETNRHTANAVIDPDRHRESDLLAFEIAIERGQPGSIMCAYNLVNGEYSCANPTLLNKVLKGDWGYKGWVMSDWGAVHGWQDALAGLDQESGEQIDPEVYFDQPLKDALARGDLPDARLADMVRRILRSMHAVGLVDAEAFPPSDPAEGEAVALDVARQGIVLLKNDGILPLAGSVKSVAMIGGRAKTGVLSGGGSSQGYPPGGWVASVPVGGEGVMSMFRTEQWYAGAPADELAKLLPKTSIRFDSGAYPEDAEALARRSDIAIVFATRHEAEAFDTPSLGLPYGQDALIARVAKANPNTIVVLQTGNPVDMPWLDDVKGVVAAWYPGQKGGQAIAEVLTGVTNPSGRLPMTFPKSLADTPRPDLPGFGTPEGTNITIPNPEGSDVGYRWYAKKDIAPLFAFGHGLSYTQFEYSELKITGGRNVKATFTVTNTGSLEGADSPQVYLTDAAGSKEMRLLGFQRVALAPGESAKVEVRAEPRILANYDGEVGKWRIKRGRYAIAVGRSATDLELSDNVTLAARTFGP